MNIKKFILILLFIPCLAITTYANDGESYYKYRIGAEFKINLANNLNLNIDPQVRFFDGYDNFLFSSGFQYKTLKFIDLRATYRLVIKRIENIDSSYDLEDIYSYSSKALHQYALDAIFKNKFGNFTPSLRVRYSNYCDGATPISAFLRYRPKLEYKINNSIFTPSIAVELFQEFNSVALNRVRYNASANVKIFENSSIIFDYKFDVFSQSQIFVNILSVGYKQSF